MLRLSVELRGYENVKLGLERVRAKIEDLSPAFREIQQSFYEMEQQQFISRGGTHSWVALSPKYEAWKQRHYPGMPLMELTGSLKKSLVAPGGENIARILPHEARFGTSVRSKRGYPYPMAHQEGRGHNPQRRLIDPSREQLLSWARIIQRHIVRGWGAGDWKTGMVSQGL